MTTKKVKFDAAQKLLLSGVDAATSACSTILEAVLMHAKDEAKAFGKETKPLARHGLLVTWAKETLKLANVGADATVTDYVNKAASVAVAPKDLKADVPDSNAENAPTHEVTRDTIRTKKELNAMAQAANKAIGKKAKSGKGRQKKVDEKPAAAPVDPNTLKLQGIAFYNAVRKAMQRNADGSLDANHDHLVKALFDEGYQINAIARTEPAQKTEPAAPTLTVKQKRATKAELAALAAKMNAKPHQANARV